MFSHMLEDIKQLAVKTFGSVQVWKKHYVEVVSFEEMQKSYAKVVAWYVGTGTILSK